MKKIRSKKDILNKLFFLFFLLYPVFDMKIFYNSFTTLGRVLIILLLTCGVLMTIPKARKNFLFLLIFLGVLSIYFFAHDWNANYFFSYVPGNFDYSIGKEFLQIMKLVMPLFVLFLLTFLPFNKKQYHCIFNCWILFICGTIVISNLFTISYGAYSDEMIKGNIFTWFSLNSPYDYMGLASKGFFEYANQITALLLCLLPYTHISLMRKFSWKRVGYISILILSLFMLGTRLSTYGSLLVSIAILFGYFLFAVIKKERWNFKYLTTIFMVLFVAFLILPFSPSESRKEVMDSIVYRTSSNIKNEEKITYIASHYQEKRIYEHFILNSYPYQYDPDFWYDILQLPTEYRIDYRYLEIAMVKRVVEINHNHFDFFLGITNTRIQNIFNIERDFILQFYAFGIIGIVLLFGFYSILGLRLFYQFLKEKTYFCLIGIGVFFLFFLCAYFSGNLLNHLSVILPIVVIFTYFMYFDEQNKEKL